MKALAIHTRRLNESEKKTSCCRGQSYVMLKDTIVEGSTAYIYTHRAFVIFNNKLQFMTDGSDVRIPAVPSFCMSR